jgi:hypothetical protein
MVVKANIARALTDLRSGARRHEPAFLRDPHYASGKLAFLKIHRTLP